MWNDPAWNARKVSRKRAAQSTSGTTVFSMRATGRLSRATRIDSAVAEPRAK
jgi:hypothetical protein